MLETELVVHVRYVSLVLPSCLVSGVWLPAGPHAVHGGVHPEGVRSSCVGHAHRQLPTLSWFRAAPTLARLAYCCCCLLQGAALRVARSVEGCETGRSDQLKSVLHLLGIWVSWRNGSRLMDNTRPVFEVCWL